MMTKYLSSAALALIASSLVAAQTHSECNPLEKDDCPDNPAVGGTFVTDFTEGHDSEIFKQLDGTDLDFDDERGAIFSIERESNAPTIASHKYIFFGRLDVELQAAPGAGIVTSIVLQSDDLDEIDWEWVGADQQNVQTNYFSKGNTTTYDRGKYHPLSFNAMAESHMYSLDWTKERIQWIIDGNLVREVTWEEAYDGHTYPQTPMQIKLGTWVAGREDAPEGTVEWAGGYADFADAPFNAYYKSITVEDYSNGVEGAKKYRYSDNTGSWESIEVITEGGDDDDDDDEDDDDKTTTTKASSTKTTSTKTSTETTVAPSSSNSPSTSSADPTSSDVLSTPAPTESEAAPAQSEDPDVPDAAPRAALAVVNVMAAGAAVAVAQYFL